MHLMKWFKLIKNILVVTGSRADYGLLKRLMKLIDSDPEMKLQIIVTGSHLSSKHGLTYKEIEKDGFQIDFKVDKNGIVHTRIGRVSFTPDKLVENAQEIISMILKLKPSAAKGTYIKSVAISSTMSPGIHVETKSLV